MRKVSLLLIMSLSLIVGLTGCAATRSAGNEKIAHLTYEEVGQRIVKGKTTKQEVLDWLGSPTETAVLRSTNEEESEMWVYAYARVKAVRAPFYVSMTTQARKGLSLTFGEDGTVSRFTFSDKNPEEGKATQ
ncbi:MAG: hypothetical protein FWG26_03815 [Betaproteobacteria bacterium]|nr:hypothetical protein [Betaproteobacteria bacterium]